MTPAPAKGEIVLEDATRFFSIRADQARTLKGLFLRSPARGPEAVPCLLYTSDAADDLRV